MSKDKIKALVLYGIFGALTTAINIVIFWLLSDVITINYLVANALAWIIAVVFAFFTNKLYVFESRGMTKAVVVKEFTEFILARAATGVLDMVFMYIGVSLLSWDQTITKVIINVIVIILNYVISKLWVFKKGEK